MNDVKDDLHKSQYYKYERVIRHFQMKDVSPSLVAISFINDDAIVTNNIVALRVDVNVK